MLVREASEGDAGGRGAGSCGAALPAVVRATGYDGRVCGIGDGSVDLGSRVQIGHRFGSQGETLCDWVRFVLCQANGITHMSAT